MCGLRKAGLCCFLAAATPFAAPPLEAAFSSGDAGLSGAQFLSLGAGARALGMGEAMASVPDGADSLYWNPAGLTAVQSRQAAFSHSQLFSDFYHDHLAYAQPFAGGAAAASVTTLNETGITAVTNTGQSLDTFHPYSFAGGLGYARRVGPWSAGLAGKLIYESLYDTHADALAVDAGAMYAFGQERLQGRGLNLGLALRDWGSQESFGGQAFPLPFELDLGASYPVKTGETGGLLLAADLALPYYSRANGKFGLEYRSAVKGSLGWALRLGYKTLSVSDLNVLSGLTAGTGLTLGRFGFDFGFEPMQGLGQIYRFSLGYGL